jgi:hypothetical protein
MKELILTLAIALSATTAMAEPNDSIKTSAGKQEAAETAAPAKKHDKKDSTYVPTYVDTDENGATVVSTSEDRTDGNDDWEDDDFDDFSTFVRSSSFDKILAIGGVAMAFVMLIPLLIFLLPIILIILILRHRSKREKERYRIIEKAVEAGQPLPDDIASVYTEKKVVVGDDKNKGIKNMCLGTGLFIFLWAVTESFGAGCIGLLVFFRGLGQYLTAQKETVISCKASSAGKQEDKPTEKPADKPEDQPTEKADADAESENHAETAAEAADTEEKPAEASNESAE